MSADWFSTRLQALAEGKLTRRTTGDYSVWCYSSDTYYANVWDELTATTRGVVTYDPEQLIVAKPLPKFFSVHDALNLPEEDLIFSEKIDGVMITAFSHKGVQFFATKGGMDPKYVDKARELWADRPLTQEGYTYVLEMTLMDQVELIIPAEKEQLYLLSVICTHTAVESSPETVDALAYYFNLNRPQRFVSTLKAMRIRAKESKDPTLEGWVALTEQGKRYKIKTLFYLEKQQIINNTSPKAVLRAWHGNYLNILVKGIIDDQPWIKSIVADLDSELRDMYEKALVFYNESKHMSKKEFSIKFKDNPYFHHVVGAFGIDNPEHLIREKCKHIILRTTRTTSRYESSILL